MIKRIDLQNRIKERIVKKNESDVKKMEKKKNQLMILEIITVEVIINDVVQNHLPIPIKNHIRYLNQKKLNDKLFLQEIKRQQTL